MEWGAVAVGGAAWAVQPVCVVRREGGGVLFLEERGVDPVVVVGEGVAEARREEGMVRMREGEEAVFVFCPGAEGERKEEVAAKSSWISVIRGATERRERERKEGFLEETKTKSSVSSGVS